MFNYGKSGRVARLFVRSDQVFDSEGPLGKVTTLAQADSSGAGLKICRHLCRIKEIVKADSIRDLAQRIDSDFKLRALSHIDRVRIVITDLRAEKKAAKDREAMGILAAGNRALCALRCRVRGLPFNQETGVAQDEQYVSHIRLGQWIRGLFMGVLVVLTGIIPPLIAVLAWALASNQSFTLALAKLFFSKAASLRLLEKEYSDQLDSASFTIDDEDRDLTYQERVSMIERWGSDFNVDVGREASHWFAAYDNFKRFLELRSHISTSGERSHLGQLMRSECRMLKWAGAGRPCHSPCQTCVCSQVSGNEVSMEEEDSDFMDKIAFTAIAAGFAAAGAVAMDSDEDEDSEEEYEEDSDEDSEEEYEVDSDDEGADIQEIAASEDTSFQDEDTVVEELEEEETWVLPEKHVEDVLGIGSTVQKEDIDTSLEERNEAQEPAIELEEEVKTAEAQEMDNSDEDEYEDSEASGADEDSDQDDDFDDYSDSHEDEYLEEDKENEDAKKKE